MRVTRQEGEQTGRQAETGATRAWPWWCVVIVARLGASRRGLQGCARLNGPRPELCAATSAGPGSTDSLLWHATERNRSLSWAPRAPRRGAAQRPPVRSTRARCPEGARLNERAGTQTITTGDPTPLSLVYSCPLHARFPLAIGRACPADRSPMAFFHVLEAAVAQAARCAPLCFSLQRPSATG